MKAHALLVDDSRSALELLKRLIEAKDEVQADTFRDPLEALVAARRKRYDIFLIDYEMPNLDGIQFTRILRSLPKFKDTPIVVITSNQDDEVRIRALEAGATDFLSKNPNRIEVEIRLKNLIKLGAAARKINDRALLLADEVSAATKALQEREEEIIMRLALAVEYRDNDTADHTLRVAKYSRLIAEQLGLPARLCRDIYLAAPLHDVGKVAISDNILLKPGRFTAAEMEEMKKHAGIGAQILADSPCELIQLAAQIASAHHEQWDGNGYPNGLHGNDIPIAARIVAVADVFDALTSKRPYKEPMPLETARSFLEEERGQKFDPACVDAFIVRWRDVHDIYATHGGLAQRPTRLKPVKP